MVKKTPENFEHWKKLKTMIMKEGFFEKQRFCLFESLLYKNGKAQIMPMVAGHLVSNSLDSNDLTFSNERLVNSRELHNPIFP